MSGIYAISCTTNKATKNTLLQKSVLKNVPILPITFQVDAKSIARGYNEGASSVHVGDEVLIFTHDDVEILSSRIQLEAAAELCRKPGVGIVGVAGTRLLSPTGIWWDTMTGSGSGACLHTDGTKVWPNGYGMFGRVAVLDGVFLMMSRKVFDLLKGFDAQIPGFEFYDIDITFRATQVHHLKNYTYPLQIIHHSQGATDARPQWHENRKQFVATWKHRLPFSVGWEPTPL